MGSALGHDLAVNVSTGLINLEFLIVQTFMLSSTAQTRLKVSAAGISYYPSDCLDGHRIPRLPVTPDALPLVLLSPSGSSDAHVVT